MMEDGDLVAWNRVKWKTQDLTEEEVTIKIARPALPDLEFVATVASGGREKFLSAV